MNIRAGLGEHILQTHNTNFFEDSMGGGVLNPLTPPSGYATDWNTDCCCMVEVTRFPEHIYQLPVSLLFDLGNLLYMIYVNSDRVMNFSELKVPLSPNRPVDRVFQLFMCEEGLNWVCQW